MGNEQALWLYLVTADTGLAEIPDGLTGVGGGTVEQVRGSGLTAVVEEVSLADFGEEPLRRHLEDLSWLEATARAHHRVIDAVARQQPVVPMRLATVYSGEEVLSQMLATRGPGFEAVLGRLTGRVEWGVKALARPAPAVPADQPAASGPGSGRAYLQRRRTQRDAREQGRQQARLEARDIHVALAALAAGSRLHPPQSSELTGQAEAMVLNAAYLLADADKDAFAAQIDSLREQHPALRLEVTGPWPPYSFAELEDEVA